MWYLQNDFLHDTWKIAASRLRNTHRYHDPVIDMIFPTYTKMRREREEEIRGNISSTFLYTPR